MFQSNFSFDTHVAPSRERITDPNELDNGVHDLSSINSINSNISNTQSMKSGHESLIFERLVQDQLLSYQNSNVSSLSAGLNKKVYSENYIPPSLDSHAVGDVVDPNEEDEQDKNSNANSMGMGFLDSSSVRRPSIMNLESAFASSPTLKRNSISMRKSISTNSYSTSNLSSQMSNNGSGSGFGPSSLQRTSSTASISYADMLNEEEKDLQSRLKLNNFRRPSITQTPSSNILTRNNSNKSLNSKYFNNSNESATNISRSPILQRNPSIITTSNNSMHSNNNNNNNSDSLSNIPSPSSNSPFLNSTSSQFSPQKDSPLSQQPSVYMRTNSLAGLSRKLSVTSQSPFSLPVTSNSNNPIGGLNSNPKLQKKKKSTSKSSDNNKNKIEKINSNESSQSNGSSFASEDADLTENMRELII